MMDSLPSPSSAYPALLLELKQVDVDYPASQRANARVLDGISLSVREGEIVAVLGPTGSGKTQLMRVAAGLRNPDAGQVLFRDAALRGVSPRIGLVFQTPALFPWLTVLSNIELGLEKLRLEEKRKGEMVAWAIDRLGLEGNEEAFPRELSSGMKVRVSLARALATQPELLVLDDPFSGLDPLAAEALRSELVDLWEREDVNPKAILLATHGIEEAVALATRVLVLSGSPAKVEAELAIPLPYPRETSSPEFLEMVGRLHDLLTHHILPDEAPGVARGAGARLIPLPRVEIVQILGLLESLEAQKGRFNVFDFVAETRREFSSVILVVKAAELLELVRTPGDRVELTELGREVVRSEVNARKATLNMQLQRLRLFAQFVELIQRSPEGYLSKEFALGQLALLFPSENPAQLFATIVTWGRYSQLLGYSARRNLLYLDRLFEKDASVTREIIHPKPNFQREARRLSAAAAPAAQPGPLPEPPAPSAEVVAEAEQAVVDEGGGEG